MSDTIETIQVPTALLPLMVDFIKQASAMAEEAEAQQVKTASDQAERSQLAANAAKELVESGLLDKTAQEKASQSLASDHNTALKSLVKIATTIRPVPMGEGVQRVDEPKTGSTKKRESDRIFEERMGFGG